MHTAVCLPALMSALITSHSPGDVTYPGAVCVCASGKWHSEAERFHQIRWFAISVQPLFVRPPCHPLPTGALSQNTGSKRGCGGGLEIWLELKKKKNVFLCQFSFLSNIPASDGPRVRNLERETQSKLKFLLRWMTPLAQAGWLTLHTVRKDHKTKTAL